MNPDPPLPTLSPDQDARITAWLLGEMDLSEAAAFEEELAASPQLKSCVLDLQGFLPQLQQLHASAEPPQNRLPDRFRIPVVEALEQVPAPPLPIRKPKHRLWLGVTAITAAAAAVAVLLPQNTPPDGLRPIGAGNRVGGRGLTPVRQGGSLATAPAAPLYSFTGSATSPSLPRKDLYAHNDREDRYFMAPATDSLASVPERGRLPVQFGATVSSGQSWHFPGTRRDLPELREVPSSESYQKLISNRLEEVLQSPLSTFSIDVDTAAYSNVRRFLNSGQRPPVEAIRLEEMVNYFPYEAPAPFADDSKPFAVQVEVTESPWNPARRLARIILKGREQTATTRAPANLVFLVDVSGSMADANKLPLVQQSLRLLTENLNPADHVSLVTYAGSTSVVLPSTAASEKARILAAIDGLRSGGSTNGAGGLQLAYQQALLHFNQEGINRVVLATDGDFNVGITRQEELLELIQNKAASGVFLSVLGYGMGNLKDDTMELLADKGNGHYAYIDSLGEARKNLVQQLQGTLMTIASDVKIQVEFNPHAIRSYRLLGYENRMLAKEDFQDDRKDAGEMGAGHTVTALYELVPARADETAPQAAAEPLRYQPSVPAAPVAAAPPAPVPAAAAEEWMTVKLRWKNPGSPTSTRHEFPVPHRTVPMAETSGETRWAIAVASFAQNLRSPSAPEIPWEAIREMARSSKGSDPFGYRGEFLQLIDKAEGLVP